MKYNITRYDGTPVKVKVYDAFPHDEKKNKAHVSRVLINEHMKAPRPGEKKRLDK